MRLKTTRAGLTLVAAILGLAQLPGVAFATAETAEPSADAYVIAEQLGITVSDAAGQLARQDAIGAIGTEAETRYADTFAGLWIDPYDGGRVSLAFVRGGGDAVRDLGRGFGRPDLLHAVPATRTWAELLAVQTRMIADREEARAGRLAFPGVTGATYDLDVDVRRNAVVVLAPGADQRTAGAFRARYGDAVIVDATRGAAPSACPITDCRMSLRSGLQISSSTANCSSAFTTTGGQIYTAAHCGSTTRHAGVTFGSVTSFQQFDKVDAETITGGSNGFYAGAWVYNTLTGEPARKITSVGTYAGLAIGAAICKTGRTTNTSCGTVNSKTFSPSYVPSGNSFIRSNDMCSQPGDSGGGVFSGNQAVGIVSGGAIDENEDPIPCGTTGFFMIFGHIQYAVSALGASVRTSEGGPSFSSVSGATSLGTTITANFNKPILCSTVSTSDWTVLINNTVSYTVTGAACSNDSDSTITLTVGTQFLPGTTVHVRQVGSESDVGGTTTSGLTRTMPVPV